MPEVRAAWLAERRQKVSGFDQLVSQGVPRYKAARIPASDVPSIDAMRRSVEQLEEGGHVGRCGNSYMNQELAEELLIRRRATA